MSKDAIDLPEFLERVQDDKPLLLELLDIFVEDFQQKRVKLQGAVQTKNFEEIRNIAHSLKGSSGNISAKYLREIFMQFEQKGKNSDLSGADDLLGAMNKRYEEFLVRMNELKRELV